MFVNAIRKINEFTRPIKFISRDYGSTRIVPGAATLFFINEDGWAITCAHVAREIVNAEKINQNYAAFKAELASIPKDKRYQAEKKHAEKRYNLSPESCCQKKFGFTFFDGQVNLEIKISVKYDIAVIRFGGDIQLRYTGFAVFAEDPQIVQPGKMMCRLGYPFPEFSNFTYDTQKDDIGWTKDGNPKTPVFPIDGMVTRHVADADGRITEIELSTPGLRGQSGGPLFTENGIVCGM